MKPRNWTDTTKTKNARIRTTNLRIPTWNIESWRNRDQEIILEMEKHQIDICALSETKKKGKGYIMVEKCMLFYSGTDKSERANVGVGILIGKKIMNCVTDTQYINERIIMLTLSLKNGSLNIISIYAPQTGRPKQERNTFYKDLQGLLDTIPWKNSVVIMGDFNGHVGNAAIPGIKQRFNDAAMNESSEDLIEFCCLNELRINNTFFDHKPQHKYTWMDNRGQKSTIDFIITNKIILPTQVLEVRILTSANIGTTHGMVLCKINLDVIIKAKSKSPATERINVEKLEETFTQMLYQSRLQQKILNNPCR